MPKQSIEINKFLQGIVSTPSNTDTSINININLDININISIIIISLLVFLICTKGS